MIQNVYLIVKNNIIIRVDNTLYTFILGRF